MKAIDDYSRFKTVLPYASELFGVYQPLIGWKSKRKLSRIASGVDTISVAPEGYVPDVDVTFSDLTAVLGHVLPAHKRSGTPASQNDSLFLFFVAESLAKLATPPATRQEWGRVFADREALASGPGEPVTPDDSFKFRLKVQVFPRWSEQVRQELQRISQSVHAAPGETAEQTQLRLEQSLQEAEGVAVRQLEQESVIAKVLQDLYNLEDIATLRRIFYSDGGVSGSPATPHDLAELERERARLRELAYEDPFLLFRPQQDLQDVSLSPVGIVHLFRQYFFEFDTFLGTPTGHVWLSPGSSVELVEVSTRKTTTEKTIESTFATIVKSERDVVDRDEISEAVKQDNRDDTKLGISSTVNQSWGSGNASATASLNLDRTQETSREVTHKRMRQQSDKVSTEIRQNFKSTFKTVTEVTDVSSKRYVLENKSDRLLNYELRRKMRRVGVQVQDSGTYLCWETYVDEPGQHLGLSNLVHIAKPADLVPQPPDQKAIPLPARIPKPFQIGAVWNFGDRRMRNSPALGYIPLDTIPLPVQPEPGYEIENLGGRVALSISSLSGEDSEGQRYAFTGRLTSSGQIEVGVVAGPGGIKWNKRVDYMLVGEVAFSPTAAKIKEIEEANSKIVADRQAATRAEQRATQEAFLKAAKERVDQASEIRPRVFEDLREEERTIVYRELIRALMTDQLYGLPESADNAELRHVLSELINAIFDVDKMLYFVAPEWWKPRRHYGQSLGRSPYKSLRGAAPIGPLGSDVLVDWSDHETRIDNYYITHDSQPAKLGSSLGWLLQLDGDDHRNAFLNAPWVKAVIPIRPGKERAAVNWLQQVNVEGAAGMDKPYAASAAELNQIKTGLLAADAQDMVADHPTVADAVRFLCLEVEQKHAESVKVKRFPDNVDLPDDRKVSATPVERVYEHGFYPLQGGFRIDPSHPDPNSPGRNFQVFDQWVEVLPTDQVVPVEVQYDPLTGQQLPPHPPA